MCSVELAQCIIDQAQLLYDKENLTYIKLSIDRKNIIIYELIKTNSYVKIKNDITLKLNICSNFKNLIHLVWKNLINNEVDKYIRQYNLIQNGIGISWTKEKKGKIYMFESIFDKKNLNKIIEFAGMVSDPSLHFE